MLCVLQVCCMQPCIALSISTRRDEGAWDFQGSSFVPGRERVTALLADVPWSNILSRPHTRRWAGWDSFLSPVSCTQDHCPPSSHLAQHFNIYLCSPCFLMRLYCTRIDFQEIYLGFFFFFLHTLGLAKCTFA